MIDQAVILAELSAPAGSSEAGDPCRELLGLGLLQRMVLALAHGGIRRILVLVRGGGACLRDFGAGDAALRSSGADVRLADAGAAQLPLPGDPFLLLGGPLVLPPPWPGAFIGSRSMTTVSWSCRQGRNSSNPAFQVWPFAGPGCCHASWTPWAAKNSPGTSAPSLPPRRRWR